HTHASFCLHPSSSPRHPLSFPTRRSSDLTAQRVVVMYAGKVIEEAPVGELFSHPRHPYTQGLIRSIPRIDTAAVRKTRLEAIGRSEEHTSELQSLAYLVCRLLLEKKK